MNRWLLIALALLMASPALAVMPDEVLDDPALEARAREVSKELRCLVCQNQSIDDSNADLARDLRVLVRERLVAGDSNDQALDFIVARYGDYVLLKPPVQANTLVLWAGPVVIFLIAGGILLIRVRRKTPLSSAPPSLTADEEARVLRALDPEKQERD
ncbi:cytochrome c-type biogenesis protein CcmH [Alphaproteobacteria bacterium HT1-32]|nr:cytochrome c-type biogenesis protein CcmH [Alphaproteobacteria bacterium HT1-32]